MNARLSVEIVERRPSTVYRGTVYDQDVLVRVDGSEFKIFDMDAIVTPDMVGTTRDIDLNVWGYDETLKLSEERRGVKPSDEGLTVRGEVIDVERELLHVGAGSIDIDTEELPSGTDEGDFVELRAACAKYLLDIEGSRDYNETYDFFLERLREDDPEIRAEAAKFLGEKGSERCLDAMISTLEDDPVPSVRASAAMALGVIGASACNSSKSRDPRIKEALQRSQDDVERVNEAVRVAEEVCEAPREASSLVVGWYD